MRHDVFHSNVEWDVYVGKKLNANSQINIRD